MPDIKFRHEHTFSRMLIYEFLDIQFKLGQVGALAQFIVIGHPHQSSGMPFLLPQNQQHTDQEADEDHT